MFSETSFQHVKVIGEVLTLLSQTKLNLKLSNCQVFQEKLNILNIYSSLVSQP